MDQVLSTNDKTVLKYYLKGSGCCTFNEIFNHCEMRVNINEDFSIVELEVMHLCTFNHQDFGEILALIVGSPKGRFVIPS